MARIKWWTYLLNEEGQIITSADIGICLAGTDDPATIYTSEDGSSTLSTDWQLKTDLDGYCEFWIGDSSDPNGYPSTQKFKIKWNKEGIVNGWNDYISILPVTIPVDLGSPSSVKDKSISNNLAIGWEEHINNESYYVHGIRPVDTEDTSSEINKLVSNEIANEWESTKWVSWEYITNDVSAEANRAYFIDASLNHINISMPQHPNIGDPVIISKIDTSNTVMLLRNGKKLFGAEEDLELTQEKSGFTLVFSGEDYGWAVVNYLSGISPLDGDTIKIDFVPSSYTRDSSIEEADNNNELSAHLKGIDNEIDTVTDNLSAHIDDYETFSDIVTNHINDDSIHTTSEGEGNVGAVYEHSQPTISKTWTVLHNLGSEDVMFEVYDVNNNRMVPQKAQIIDENTIELTFENAVKGRCIVGGMSLSDNPYSSSDWNNNMAGATKNAIRDKIEDMVANTDFLSGEVYENTTNISENTTNISNLQSDVTWLSGEVEDVKSDVYNTKYEYVNIPAKDFIDADNPPSSLETFSFSLSGGKSQLRKFSGYSEENVIIDFETNEDIVTDNGIQYKVVGYITETQSLTGDGLEFETSSFPMSNSEPLSGEYIGNITNTITGLYLDQYHRFETGWSNNMYINDLNGGDGLQIKFKRGCLSVNDTYENSVGISCIKLRYSKNIL